MFFGRGLKNPVGIGFRFGRGIENPADLRYIFIRGMENPADLRSNFGRGMENRVGIRPRFIQGMDFWVGIRFIRPLACSLVGRMQYAHILTDENSIHFFVHSASGVAACGAYSIRPYPDGRISIHFFTHSTTGVAVYGAYAVALYTDYRKPTGNRVRISRGGGKGGGAWVVRKVG